MIYPVKDVAHAKVVYSTLFGVAPYADDPYYVGYKIGDLDIGLDPSGHGKGMTGPVCYVHVDDIYSSFKALLEAGALSQQEVMDVGGGTLTALFKDNDGNLTGLIQRT